MKPTRALTMMTFIVAMTVHASTVEPGLPEWNEGERKLKEKEGWIAGGILLSNDPVPNVVTKSETESFVAIKPMAEEITEPKVPPTEIPQKFWSAYFDKKPESFLVDPQGLLSPTDYRDRLAFLNYHASDSSIDLYVYVFKGDQEIPGEVREEELIERFFSQGRPAAVVYYFMSAPQLSVIYLSPSLTDSVSAVEQRRALESSVMQAFAKRDPSSQIEAFLVQMSIRIYWMERMMGGGAVADVAAPATVYKTKQPSIKPSIMSKLQPMIERLKPMVLPMAILLGTLLVGLTMTWWLRRRARYYFPEFEVEPRLGGDHAAGVGAVISFASAAVPPASQRDQVPDYLRRY
jgi:hypothetical protein